ncbi:carbohydrate kinase family protein, partial [archaeon]|nr:carbohydrate kinase family protein [archaeon]
MDVIGIGALNFDYLYMVEKIAGAGEEETVHSLVEAPGGSAANTIAGLSRLGARTGFIGTVGRDREGEFILRDMKKEKVDTSGVTKTNGATGTILGFVDKRGERALYAYPGVNDILEINKRQAKLAASAKYVHLSSFVGGGPLLAQKNLLKELKDTKVSFAPGMLYAGKFSKIKPIIKKSAILFLNMDETELITG